MADGKQTVSIIIPVRNRPKELEECLQRLRACIPPPDEVIVVDDASTDATVDVARSFNAKVVVLQTPSDANVCRNTGAGIAHGDILLFLYSDVLAFPNLIGTVRAIFADRELDAAVGLYSELHRHSNVVSQYKNLWIRFSYLRSKERIDWIFGAISAIRKTSFDAAGGFDGALFMKHGGEDLELGKRMAFHRRRIALSPAMEVEHLKHHTLVTLLQNDLRRSDGFVRAAKRVGHLGSSVGRGFVNVYPSFVYSVPLAWCILAAFGYAAAMSGSWLPFSAAATLYAGFNAQFIVYFSKRRGLAQTIPALGVLFLDHLVCGVGIVRGVVRLLFF